jgi:hypothetical protein
MHDIVQFLRSNPQAAILLAICLVLGVGTLIALLIGVLSSGPTPSSSNSDSGAVALFQVLVGW